MSPVVVVAPLIHGYQFHFSEFFVVVLEYSYKSQDNTRHSDDDDLDDDELPCNDDSWLCVWERENCCGGSNLSCKKKSQDFGPRGGVPR